MTVGNLRFMLFRHVCGHLLYGCGLLVLAGALWGGIIYLAFELREHGSRLVVAESVAVDHIAITMAILLLAINIWLGFFHSELFFFLRIDSDLPALRPVWPRELLSPSWMTLILAVFCWTPIVIILAGDAFCRVFRLCFFSRVKPALTIYRYLENWGDWVPYPKLESQRQAVILLAQLGLVRVTRRFGKHQVKVSGSRRPRTQAA